MGEILAAGGPGYLIPAVLFVLVLYSVRGVFGLHGRRSQHRKDFLELWSDDRRHDDLWLEVAIRHLFGTYLPAPIIRLAMGQPDKSQALLDISELWALLHFDPETQTVHWLFKRHQTLQRRRAGRVSLFLGYFVCALIALFAGWISSKTGPATFSGWLYGVCAVITGVLAFTCLMREDTMKVAVSVGDNWLARINGLSIKPEIPLHK